MIPIAVSPPTNKSAPETAFGVNQDDIGGLQLIAFFRFFKCVGIFNDHFRSLRYFLWQHLRESYSWLFPLVSPSGRRFQDCLDQCGFPAPGRTAPHKPAVGEIAPSSEQPFY